MQAYLYGANSVIEGLSRELYELMYEFKSHMLTQTESVVGPGPSQGDVSDIVCQYRVFRWSARPGNRPAAIEIEADARNIDIILNQLNLMSAKTADHPPGCKVFLPSSTLFSRSLCVKVSYLSPERGFCLQRNRASRKRLERQEPPRHVLALP